MVEVKTTYAVVLTFSGEIRDTFSKLRADFQKYMGYTIVPHITLVYPFVLTVDISSVIGKLKEVAKRNKPFTLTLDGVEYFEGENNVAYVAIKNKPTIKALDVDIMKSLKGLIKGYYGELSYYFENYVPHMTIGEHIPEEVFPGVKKRFADYKLHRECNIVDLSLFSEENGIWKRVKSFSLSG